MIAPPPDYYGKALARAVREGVHQPEVAAALSAELSERIDASLGDVALLDDATQRKVEATIKAFLLDLERRDMERRTR